MEISLANAKKLNWLWQDEHEIEWIETFIQAVDKSGKVCKYKLTDEQKALLQSLDHKNVISKSRQLGISYVVCSISLRRCICHPNTTCVLISHSQESTNKVFAKLKQQFYSIPDIIRPELLTNNRQELSFVNGSRISCQTAGNKDLCRGDTINGVLHVDNGTIKSKVLDNACSYPVYDDMGEYIAFIEHWTDAYTAISFWNVYYPTYVEHWDNEGGEMRLTSTDNSVGLPIHYHNFNDEDYNFGVALLNDIKPIMDALEDVMAKMSDSIYVNVMNPMPVAIGQRIESSIPADAVGYVMNLDVGDFKYANCSLDYNSIKLYLDNMKQFLNDVACMPSVLGSSTNIANISEVSMQILLMMASVYADENKKWLNIGFQKRFEMFKKILGMQGIKVDSDVEVIYNVAMPVASTEMIANLKALQEMGAISKETIMEKTEYVSDVEVEKKRLSGENSTSPNGENLKTTDNMDNFVDK